LLKLISICVGLPDNEVFSTPIVVNGFKIVSPLGLINPFIVIAGLLVEISVPPLEIKGIEALVY